MKVLSASIRLVREDGTLFEMTTQKVVDYSIEVQELVESDQSIETRKKFLPDSDTTCPQKYSGPLRFFRLVFEAAPGSGVAK